MQSGNLLPWIWTFYGLFLLRVMGQVPVMWAEARGGRILFLPPAKQWYSGLLPYPVLFLFQILYLVIMAWMIMGLSGRGPFGPPGAGLAEACILFSVPYFGFMVYRWVFRVLLNPTRRWYDTVLPIVFHCVLAGFLLLYGMAGRKPVARITVSNASSPPSANLAPSGSRLTRGPRKATAPLRIARGRLSPINGALANTSRTGTGMAFEES